MKRTLIPILLCFFACTHLTAADNNKKVDLEQLDNYIQKTVADFELTGLAITIVKDSSVVFSKGYGFRNVETQEPVTTGSLFNIASCSKAFSSACLAMLVDEGKLSWKDKVIDYVAGFQLADPCITAQLNMVDILSHRSGLDTFYGDLLWYETDYSNQEIIHRMRFLPVKNEFRSEYGYQNNMYMISGEIVRQITGKPWAEFLTERIFQPLEMTESRTSSGEVTPQQELAHPHIDGKRITPANETPNPAGSIFSSVDELSHWILMLLNEGQWQGKQILSAAVIEDMFTPRTLLRVSDSMRRNGSHFNTYGLGWFMFDYAGKKIAEHSGGMPGYISKVTLVPEENLGMAILTNDLNVVPNALRYKILDLYLSDKDYDWAAHYLDMKDRYEKRQDQQQAEREARRAKNTKPSLALQEYAGKYVDKMYGPAQMELKDKKLHLTLLPTKEVFVSKMEHWHYDTFRIKFKDEFLPQGFVTFNFSSNGEVTGFKIDLPNPDFHFYNLNFKKAERAVTE